MRLRSIFLLGLFPFIIIAGTSKSFLPRCLAGFQLNWHFKDFSYFDPQGSWGAEDVQGKITYDGRKLRPSAFETTLSLEKGSFLYDKWYFDWGQTPLFVRINGSLSEDALTIANGDLQFSRDASLNLKGKIDVEKKAFCLDEAILDVEDAAKTYYLFLGQPLQTIYPILKEIAIDGKLRVEGANFCYPRLKGEIWASFEGDIALPSVTVEDLKLSIPVVSDLPEEKAAFIQVGRIVLRDEAIGPLHLRLSVKGGQISLVEALQFSFEQGRVSILSLEGTSYPLCLKGSLALENIHPRSIPLLSNLRSEILQFELTPNQLDVVGDIVISIFGGEVVITNVKIEKILSRYPKIRADIEFKHIDLAQVSQHFAFGAINGIIKGYIKNLLIAYGQPETFNLLMESVAEKGIRQTISLAAVNNISILAHGSPVIVSWLFPKTFPYQRIGIQCSLKNDYFVIHGLMKDEGNEYLIKRGLFGIDVVNRSPGQMVAFKEMVDRFKQINGREEK